MLKKTLKMTAFLSSLAIMVGMAKPISVDAATTYVKATANVNVRTGASTKYKSIDTLKKGNVVKVLSSKSGWYKIQLSNKKTGWSSKKYLTTTKSPATTNTTSTTSTTKNTNASATATVNVRTGASTKYKVIDKLSKGEKVKVLSTSGSWYKIQFDGNKTGWANKSYIKKTSSSTSTSSTTNVAKTLTVKAYAYTGGGYTAMGTKAKYGTLAVDPKVIPYGTKVYIKELDKVFTAEDCGGGIKGNKVDIYMNTQADCRSWGVRTITLQILK